MCSIEAYLILTLIAIATVNSQIISRAWEVEGYYWRDFTGDIPKDAYAGGTDINGKPIYIGQVLHGPFLVPAKIYTTGNKAYFEYGGNEHETTTNVKILCTQHPEQFEWIATDNDKIKLLTDKHLLIGGYEPGIITYIGRVRSGGEIAIGKVLVHYFFLHAGLHVTQNGSGKRHTTFDVLAFDPNAPKIGLPYKI